MKLNLKSLALTFGILFGAVALVVSVWFSATGYASGVVKMLSEIYGNLIPLADNGKKFASVAGGISLLTLFTFVDGAIAGILIGLFYNMFLPKGAAKDSKTSKE
jgi:hypothetical protein